MEYEKVLNWSILDVIYEPIFSVDDGDYDVVYANLKAKELFGEGAQIKNIKDFGIDKLEVVHVYREW